MTTGIINRLFELFQGSGLRYRVSWGGNRIVAITVFQDMEYTVMVSAERPAPTDEQLTAIAGVLEAEELAEEDTTEDVYLSCTEVAVLAVRYSKRR